MSRADIKNRGVIDTFFLVCDGLKGLPVISELGGVVDGVNYEVSDLPELSQDQLLFLNVRPDGKYETVAGGQGRFVPDSAGGYVSATSPDLHIDAAGLSELPSLIGP